MQVILERDGGDLHQDQALGLARLEKLVTKEVIRGVQRSRRCACPATFRCPGR